MNQSKRIFIIKYYKNEKPKQAKSFNVLAVDKKEAFLLARHELGDNRRWTITSIEEKQ